MNRKSTMNNNKLEITVIEEDGTTFTSFEQFNSKDLVRENFELKARIDSLKLAICSLVSVLAGVIYLYIIK